MFTPEEVPIPGFLFDDPVVRKELAHYYSSVRRADDCVGQVLAALKASGEEDKTVVMFLSDHGMPLPFAKTQLYHHSTHTPLVIRWPGVTQAGSRSTSGTWFRPSIFCRRCSTSRASPPAGLGRARRSCRCSKGESQAGRDMVVKEYNENSGGSRDPMRAIETKQFLYVFNAWSTASGSCRPRRPARRHTATCGSWPRPIRRSRPASSCIEHRVVEELYDVQHDPDALKDLIDDPSSRDEVDRLRAALEEWMKATGDPMLEVFRQRDDPAARDAYMKKMEKETAKHRQAESHPGLRNSIAPHPRERWDSRGRLSHLSLGCGEFTS